MMEKNTQGKGLRAAFALALALALTLVPATLAPVQAHAAEAAAFTYDASGNKVEYATINDAVAANTGKTIYLARDVQTDEQIVIGEGKAVTIDMMGHVIKSTNTSRCVFYVEEDANLTVTSSSTAKITFEGYGSRGKKKEYTVTTGASKATPPPELADAFLLICAPLRRWMIAPLPWAWMPAPLPSQ